MADPSPHVLASRQLLEEVCVIMAPFRDDAVLIGGWVPDIRFPDACPQHVGSIDVDFAVQTSRERHAQLVAMLVENGFRAGEEPYQFKKNITVGNHSIAVKLDLLTSQQCADALDGVPHAPLSASGAEQAFRDSSVESVGRTEVRVASVVAFIIMKAHAMEDRDKAKDAYDLCFCLKNYPYGIPMLAREFADVVDHPPVREILTKLAAGFRDEESRGPRDVVEVEGSMGEARAIRKFEVFTLVDDFLREVGITR